MINEFNFVFTLYISVILNVCKTLIYLLLFNVKQYVSNLNLNFVVYSSLNSVLSTHYSNLL